MDVANSDLHHTLTGLAKLYFYDNIPFVIKENTMSQDTLIKLKSDQSKHIIRTVKNKKQNPDKLKLRKYDKTLRKHVTFTEAKK